MSTPTSHTYFTCSRSKTLVAVRLVIDTASPLCSGSDDDRVRYTGYRPCRLNRTCISDGINLYTRAYTRSHVIIRTRPDGDSGRDPVARRNVVCQGQSCGKGNDLTADTLSAVHFPNEITRRARTEVAPPRPWRWPRKIEGRARARV